MDTKILLVEDEKPISTMLEFALKKQGFDIIEAENWFEAEAIIESKSLDLLLIDWMLPEVSGIEIVKNLRSRKQFQSLPIIMLTARTEESYKIRGLEAGADDYITKPFSPHELVARIKALLRRSVDNQLESNILEMGSLRIDINCHQVSLKGKTVELGPTEFRLLVFMLENPNRVFSRESLLNQVWSRSIYVEKRTVDVHILRLRKALAIGNYDKYIQTVRGIGYRLSKHDFKLTEQASNSVS